MENEKKEYPASVFIGQFKPYKGKDGKVTGWYLMQGAYKFKLAFPKDYNNADPCFNAFVEQMPPKTEQKQSNVGFGA